MEEQKDDRWYPGKVQLPRGATGRQTMMSLVAIQKNEPSYYLYLTRKEWVKNWVEGGMVPLSLTTKYISSERSGIYTPDEDLHQELTGIDYSSFEKVFKIPEDSLNCGVSNIQLEYKDEPAKIVDFYKNRYPALVLCLSTERSVALAERLGKEACVEVTKFQLLKVSLDRQLGVLGTARACEYTHSKDRNHFLKSHEDEWQHEFRIIWQRNREQMVRIPRGVCREIEL